MLKERHFRVCKRLATVSTLVSGSQGAETSRPSNSRTFSGISVPSKEACYERPQAFCGNIFTRRDTERVNLCSRSRILSQHTERALFTSASSRAVTHTSPERKSTDTRKTNLDLKTKTARKPAAKHPGVTSRHITSQKVNSYAWLYLLCNHQEILLN